MITIKSWRELNGTYYAMPLHKDYPNMYAVGLTAKQSIFRIKQKIENK